MPKFESKFHKTLDRAINNEGYGKDLKSMALAAGKAGMGSRAWAKLTAEFSDNPAELAQMKYPGTQESFDPRICTILATGHGAETGFLRTLVTLSLACQPTKGGATKKRATKTKAGKKSAKRK